MVLPSKTAVIFLIKFYWRGGVGAMNIGGPQRNTKAIDICVSAEFCAVICCTVLFFCAKSLTKPRRERGLGRGPGIVPGQEGGAFLCRKEGSYILPVYSLCNSCAHSAYAFLGRAQLTHHATGSCHFCRQCPSCVPLLGARGQCTAPKTQTSSTCCGHSARGCGQCSAHGQQLTRNQVQRCASLMMTTCRRRWYKVCEWHAT